jgi:choline dehydrogenase-like flavoprotein
MCTAPMGTDAKDSVVDANLVHHKYRNVVVTGASAFPNAPAANPTLTLSALSLRSAARILGA